MALGKEQMDMASVLDEVVERIAPLVHPTRMILFGSLARGDATASSDVDLLVLVDTDGSRRQIADRIDKALADRTFGLDVIVMTTEQFERQKGVVGTVARQVWREGKVLYDSAA